MKRMISAYVLALLALAGLAVFAHAAPSRRVTNLKIGDVPPAVQKAIAQETARHSLQTIAMNDDDGAGLYEASFTDGQQQIELKIAANGQVVSREKERGHKEDQEETDD